MLVDYDALVAPLGFGFPGESRPLWRDRMVCIVDRGNPGCATGPDPRRTWPSCRTRSRGFGPGVITPVDRVFGELGIERHIQVQVAGWLPLPFVIEGTELVAVVPERLARLHARRGPRW